MVFKINVLDEFSIFIFSLLWMQWESSMKCIEIGVLPIHKSLILLFTIITLLLCYFYGKVRIGYEKKTLLPLKIIPTTSMSDVWETKSKSMLNDLA